MENLKLISIRLNPELLSKIDATAKRASYRNRSSVIANILQNIFDCSDDATIAKLIDTWFAKDKNYKVSFRAERIEPVYDD